MPSNTCGFCRKPIVYDKGPKHTCAVYISAGNSCLHESKVWVPGWVHLVCWQRFRRFWRLFRRAQTLRRKARRARRNRKARKKPKRGEGGGDHDA